MTHRRLYFICIGCRDGKTKQVSVGYFYFYCVIRDIQENKKSRRILNVMSTPTILIIFVQVCFVKSELVFVLRWFHKNMYVPLFEF